MGDAWVAGQNAPAFFDGVLAPFQSNTDEGTFWPKGWSYVSWNGERQDAAHVVAIDIKTDDSSASTGGARVAFDGSGRSCTADITLGCHISISILATTGNPLNN